MEKLTATDVASNTRHWRRMLSVVWRWLTEPSPSIIEPERRIQARLLMAMLLVLLFLGLLSLTLSFLGLYSNLEEPEVESHFRWITIFAILLLAVEYGLSRTVHYASAAILVIGTVLISVFVVMIISPGELQYLSFLILGGLIASLFLSARTTAIVFVITFAGSLLLPAFVSGYSASNNIYVLFFILTVGGLVVMAALLRGRYVKQIAVQTQQLVESEARLRELSIRDPLTGLFNRRYLEESLELEMIRALRQHYPIGIIMADIDHFKRLNDTYGHLAGDAVLVQVGMLLPTLVRGSDPVCRYGGEEFILVLPGASLEITQKRAELMREGIKNIQMQDDGQTLEAVTLSLGVAVFPDHGSTIDAILRAADIALYRAKRAGRDRVMVAD
jgi:diguanylate cyclase (GGDEF)-like protein